MSPDGGTEAPTVLIGQDLPDLFRFLESRGLISRLQSHDLRHKVVLGTESLAERLVENGLAAKAVATALGDYFGISSASSTRLTADPATLSKLASVLWRKALALPVGVAQGKVLMVTSDPSLTVLHDELERAIGMDLQWTLVPVPTLRAALGRALGPKLIVRRDDGSKQNELVLRSKEIHVGKHPDNQLSLEDPTVSRKHARLVEDGEGRWTLFDLGSANGSFVDGQRIDEKKQLVSGSRIRLGQTEIVFYDAGDEAEGLATDQVSQPEMPDRANTELIPSQPSSPASPKDEMAVVDPEPKPSTSPSPPPASIAPTKKASGKKKSKKAKKVDSRMKAAWVRVAGQFIATLAAVLVPVFIIQSMNRDSGAMSRTESRAQQPFRETFPGRFEPSGVIQLADGSDLYFVDDSKPGALFRFEIDARGRIRGDRVQQLSFSSPVEALDLEGLTIDPESGSIYALSSHALDKKARVVESALLRLETGESGLEVVDSMPNLRELLLSNFPLLEKAGRRSPRKHGLNLEAIAWDSTRQRLLIGARGPLETTYIGDEALVFSLESNGPFELGTATFADDPIFLNLDGYGLRGMEFDPETQLFLLISGGATKAGEFRIWEWDGETTSDPRWIRGIRFAKGQKPEGITRVRLANGDSVVLLVDDSGGYFVLSADDLAR